MKERQGRKVEAVYWTLGGGIGASGLDESMFHLHERFISDLLRRHLPEKGLKVRIGSITATPSFLEDLRRQSDIRDERLK